MKFYLAGPMSGYAQFNFPAFIQAAKELRAMGFGIISPAEMDKEAGIAEAAMASKDGKLIDGKIEGQTWGDVLARDVKVVADIVDGIIFLPNWITSKGARLEAYIALITGKRVFMEYFDGRLTTASPFQIHRGVIENWSNDYDRA